MQFLNLILGRGDQVRCFQCSAGLERWGTKDSPWEEHAKWYPNCEFLQLNKGKAYVNKVQAHKWNTQQNLDTSNDQKEMTRDETCSSVNLGIIPMKKEENTLNEDNLLCRICLIEKVNIAFIPCGHVNTCGMCSANSLAISKICPICRTTV